MRKLCLVLAIAAAAVPAVAQRSGGPPQSATASSAQPSGTGIIAGQLVDAGTAKPVSSARIYLSAVTDPSAQRMATGSGVTMTDGSGRFVFHSLKAGSYNVRAEGPGYISTAYGATSPDQGALGRVIALTDGQRLVDIAMKIWKFGSLSGRLVDEAGEPAVGATLTISQVTGAGPSQRFLSVGNNAQTDDRGDYRFFELVPGNYVVWFPSYVQSLPLSVVDAYEDARQTGNPSSSPVMQALQATGGSYLSEGRQMAGQLISTRQGDGMAQWTVDSAGRMMVYPVALYPGTRTLADATRITVESGQERTGINFSIRPIPASSVSGTVSGPDGPAASTNVRFVPTGLEVLPSNGGGPVSGGYHVASAVTRADGTFTAVGVPAGDYTAVVQRNPITVQSGPSSSETNAVINVGGGSSSFSSGGGSRTSESSGPMLWGRTSVVVGTTDVLGVSVRLSPGVTISGRIEFEPGTAPPPTPEQLQRALPYLAPVNGMTVIRASNPVVAADGSFKTAAYAPGQYAFSVSSTWPGWTLKTITVAGRELAAPFDLPSTDMTGVVVTFTDKAGEVSGSITGSTGGEVGMFLMPADYQRWISAGMNMRSTRPGQVRPDGTYRVPGVVAGDYIAVAASMSTIQKAAADSKLMSELARLGTRVTLTDREKKSLALSVVTVRLP